MKIAFGMMLELLCADAFRCRLRTELKVGKGIMMDPDRKLTLKLKFNENRISQIYQNAHRSTSNHSAAELSHPLQCLCMARSGPVLSPRKG